MLVQSLTLILLVLALTPSSAIFLKANTKSQEELDEFWTKERMQQASYEQQPSLLGSSQSDCGRIPLERVDSSFTYPYSTTGRLFFTTRNGLSACSGAVVNSNGKNVIATAAHCIFAAGDIFSNVVFAPQYENGATPFGRIRAHSFWFSDCYASRFVNRPAGTEDDVAFVVLCEPIETKTRGLEIFRSNVTEAEYFHAAGYPSTPHPSRGEFLYSAIGRACSERNPIPQGCNSPAWSMGFQTSPGFSGSPYFFQRNETYWLAGVHSFGSGGTGYGRMLTEELLQIFDNANAASIL